MPALDYAQAAALLREIFQEAEQDFQSNATAAVAQEIVSAADSLFASRTQSYREALLGCGLAHLLDPTINIRAPM